MIQAKNTKGWRNVLRTLNLLVITLVKVNGFSWYDESRNCGTALLESPTWVKLAAPVLTSKFTKTLPGLNRYKNDMSTRIKYPCILVLFYVLVTHLPWMGRPHRTPLWRLLSHWNRITHCNTLGAQNLLCYTRKLCYSSSLKRTTFMWHLPCLMFFSSKLSLET